MTDPFASAIRRDIVVASGPDTITFLQGQMSQDLASLGVGDATWSLLLQPQGKVDAWVRVHRAADEEVRIDVDAGAGHEVVARLERFKLRTRCDLSLLADVPSVAVRSAMVEGGLACGWPGIDGVDVLGTDIDALTFGPDVLLYEEEEFEAERIRFGVPHMGAEITPDTIPAELGEWLIRSSVSFSKGCFTGQELVARIDSRGGNVPRHLRVFTTTDLPPAPGTVITAAGGSAGEGPSGDGPASGKALGTVTSSAIGAWGDCVGMAFIHRSMTPPFDANASGVALHFPETRPEP